VGAIEPTEFGHPIQERPPQDERRGSSFTRPVPPGGASTVMPLPTIATRRLPGPASRQSPTVGDVPISPRLAFSRSQFGYKLEDH
jgi:hypothetical protein